MTPLLLLVQAIEAFLATFATSSTLANVIRSLLAWAIDIDGKAGGSSFVWRPGEPSPSGNVFATWAGVYAALVATQGARTVVIDTSLAAAVIPPGSYNMQGVTLQGYRQAQPVNAADLSDGATLVDLLGLTRLELRTLTTGAGQLTFTPSNPNLFLELGSINPVSGVAPIQYAAVGLPGLQIGMIRGATLGDGVNPVIDLGATGGALLYVEDAGNVQPESVIGTPGSNLALVYTDGAGLPPSLSGFSGTLIRNPLPNLVQNVLYVSVNGNDFSGDGSRQRPLSTLQEALNRATSGTEIRLTSGQYDGAVIPTTPPLNHLAIVGEGRVVIGSNFITRGLELSADATNADQILSLRLQNLTIRGDIGLLIDDSNPANDTFLQEGLFVDGCQLEGTLAACSIGRASLLFFRDNNTAGDSFFLQCGQGKISGNFFADSCEFNFNSSAAFPFLGTTLYLDSNVFASLVVQGSGTTYFSKDNQCATLTVSPRILAGDPIVFHYQGWADNTTVDYVSTDAGFHDVNFDQAHLGGFDSFFDANPAAVRQAISMRSAATGIVTAGAEIDIDLEDSSNIVVVAGGIGPTLGTIRRQFSENITLNLAPATLVFNNPMPDANYSVAIEPSALCEWYVTNKTSTGFDFAGSVAGVFAVMTVTPQNN